ncbi:hypothetical protein [Haloglomus halophilum]|uniref:hypothetical protein n=1 Tax=Haloglomus halophilum TaxID=2962672 RepID=UPI0020C9D91F|nr:hypothetical protein [Haloglomus halophilum]
MASLRPSHRLSVVSTLVLALLLAIQPAAAAAMAPGPTTVGATPRPALAQSDGTNESDGLDADHVYVERDGDVILVSNGTDAASRANATVEDDSLDEVRNASFGLVTGQGLLYGLYETDRSELAEDGETFPGTFSFATRAAPDRLAAGGTFATERPAQLQAFRLALEGARTGERAGATLDGRATVTLNGSAAAGAVLERAETDSYARVGPRNLTLRSNGTARVAPAAAGMADPFRFSAVLTEEPGVYRLAVERNSSVGAEAVGNWSTRERARATLERRFAGQDARQVANTSLRLRDYAFRNASDGEGGRVVVSYVVRYEGVKARLRPLALGALTADEENGLDPLQAQRITADLFALRVERAAVDATYRDGRFEGSTELRLNRYDRAIDGALDLATAYNLTANETVARYVRGFRTRFDAAREAGLVREYRLGTTYERPGAREATVEVTGRYRTTNWDAYVAELDERGVTQLDLTGDLHARADGDHLRGNASVAAVRPGLLADAVDGLRNLSRAGVEDEFASPAERAAEREEFNDTQEVLDAFERSDLRTARFELNVTDEAARIEGAARFGNLSAFRPLLRNDTTGELPTDLVVREAVARPRPDGGSVVYVYAEGAVPVRPTEADVRALAAVNESTTVHMPGEWDRSFPRVDRERAYGVLRETPPEPTPTETPLPPTDGTNGTSSGGQPGFGPTAAAVALVAGVVVLARRRGVLAE